MVWFSLKLGSNTNISDICHLMFLSHSPVCESVREECVYVCVFVVYSKQRRFFFVFLSELLTVPRANTCTESVYTLQQVALLPVHRCASAPESSCHYPVHRPAPSSEAWSQPVYWPAPERLQLPATDWTRQDIYICRNCFLPSLPRPVWHVISGDAQSVPPLCHLKACLGFFCFLTDVLFVC